MPSAAFPAGTVAAFPAGTVAALAGRCAGTATPTRFENAVEGIVARTGRSTTR